jgi:demethylspheroidene O-methyltransferase
MKMRLAQADEKRRMDIDTGAVVSSSLQDRFYKWRDDIVASPRFQRWAAAFPFTRGIASRQSRELFDLCAGFVYSQILVACVELDLFRILANGPQTSDALAATFSLSPDVTERLLRGGVALGLFATRGKEEGSVRYGLGMKGAALLGNPGVVSMIKHHYLFYADLADPLALLKNASAEGERKPTALNQFWPYAQGGLATDQKAVAPYSALMSSSQSIVVDDILESYPFQRHQHVMDIGGGEGTFLISLAKYAPHLQLTLFDLPAVAAKADHRFKESQLSSRATAVGGNAATDPLPQRADLITLIRVLHDHDDDRALAILGGIHKALPLQGRLLIAEPMAGVKGAETMGDAYFGFYLLAMGSGRPRRSDEIQELLRVSGFKMAKILRTRRPMLTSAIVAEKH